MFLRGVTDARMTLPDHPLCAMSPLMPERAERHVEERSPVAAWSLSAALADCPLAITGDVQQHAGYRAVKTTLTRIGYP
ncbi:MAG: hypothetical protein OEM84_14495 [Acidimicrobiia bacterium]|nr:hypothetical protein [Acidimicrobiia bacterium]